MEEIFQLLDCDYILLNNLPVVRLFGKNKEGKTVCAFYEKFLPYFYVLPKNEKFDEIVDLLKKSFASILSNIEMVKKFKPIGYSEEPVEMLKITLTDPSRTPEVREFLRTKEVVEEIFEADILFKYRFMADMGINGMKWLKVTGNPTKTNSVKVGKAIVVDKIETTDDIDNAEFRYMGIDIEVVSDGGHIKEMKEPIGLVSLSFFPAYKGKSTIVLVAKQIKKFDHDVMAFDEEKEMLAELIEIIDNYDPDIIVGYNANNFDFPYINERLKHFKLPRTIGRDNSKSLMSQKIGENKMKNSVIGRIFVDPYWMIREMIKGGGLTKYFAGLKRFGLGDVSKFFLDEDKVDVAHSEISKFWIGNEEQLRKLVDYSRKDAELALKLLLEKGFLNKYIGISLVSGVLLQDALDGGETTRVELLLLKEFNKENFVLSLKPSSEDINRREKERETYGLKGALVLDPVIGFHDKCVAYLDFASMYPSIFISYNICPTTIMTEKSKKVPTIKTPAGVEFVDKKIRQGIIPKTVLTLINERAKVKNELPKEKDPTRRRALDAKQEALKRMTNSFYGYTGFLLAKVYMLNIANAVTGTGRYYIQKTKEIVEKETTYKVIYGDTDSLMIKLNTNNIEEAFKIGEQVSELINIKLERQLRLKVEYIFKSLIILAKKRYTGWSFEPIEGGWNEDITMKGIETVRRDWCDLVGESLNKILHIILVDQKPKEALDYMKETIQKLQNNEIPVEKLVITKGMSKKIEDYKGTQPHVALIKKMRRRDIESAPGVGDRIGFVIIRGSQLMSERAEDPDYVKSHGLKIDSKYYIESQLLPPLERVFEAIGIKRSELLNVGKQMQLGEMIRNGLIKTNGNGYLKTTEPLKDAEGIQCSRCSRNYRRPPLLGKCTDCNGELVFYNKENKSKIITL